MKVIYIYHFGSKIYGYGGKAFRRFKDFMHLHSAHDTEPI